MRKLNGMFSIDGERLIKTSNGQPVPEDEPLFILRGRDDLAAATLQLYWALCRATGVPQDRLDDTTRVIIEFMEFKHAHPTKLPGSTHGR